MKKTILFLAMLTVISCVLAGCASAQEPMSTDDLFTIPADATADQLEERLMAMMTHRPEGITTQEQATAYMEKRNAALQTIAGLMLKRDEASQEQKDTAREIQLQVIAMDARNDLDKALTNVEAYQKELAEIKSDVLYQAQMMVFQLKISKIVRAARLGEEGDHIKDFKQYLEDAKTFLTANEFQSDYAMLPMMLLQVGEMLDENGKEGLQKFVIAELKPILEKTDADEAKEVLAMMEGLLRFAELPGREIEFQCVLLDGKKLDIKDFRDKVVLVDFWATWCGPCLMSIPTMKQLYDKYHDKGFELIAYSCDQDLDDLKQFEEQSPHPWHVASVILSKEAELTDYSTFYGIPGYPTFVLVGKDGKVLHVTHSIHEIAEKLAEMF
ncbi:MAG: TlpA family protein disulfide reductase [Planctomycetaceae bacterium]|nr:TlpA family protein disulfide reductase [Planctomycetaceae bacterium]